MGRFLVFPIPAVAFNIQNPSFVPANFIFYILLLFWYCLKLFNLKCYFHCHYSSIPFVWLAEFSFEGTHIVKQLHCAEIIGCAVFADTGWFLSDSTAKREILRVVCIVSILCVVLTSHCEVLPLPTVDSVWHVWTPGMFLNLRSSRSAVLTSYFRSRLRRASFLEVF
jgi:hypothetical protein